MHILIIEDEIALCQSIAEGLRMDGYEIDTCFDGNEGLDLCTSENYDLILLDLNLPGMDGLEILRHFRRMDDSTPVLILSARGQIQDKVEGLDLGANDYITKPFHMKELVARIKVILKRNSDIDDTDNMKFGDLTLDLKTGKMKANQNEIAINGKELELLESLLLNKNQIMSRETLANKIWGYDSDAEYNNVEVYVSFLRKKLKILQSNVMIKAVRGIGYKLEAKVEK